MKNKKKIISIMCLALACTVAATSFTGCSSKSDDDETKSSSDSSSAETGEKVKFLYKNEKITLPDGIDYVSALSADSENIYTVNTEYNYDETTGIENNITYFYKIAFDGTIVSKTDISPVKEGDNDSANYNSIMIGKDNTFWGIEYHYIMLENNTVEEEIQADDDSVAAAEVDAEAAVGAGNPDTAYVENSSAKTMAVEETVTETVEETEPVEETAVEETTPAYKTIMYLRHLDSDGTELLKLNISDIASLKDIVSNDGSSNSYISAIKTDNAGNVYVVWENYDDNSTHFTVLDQSGKELYTIDSGEDMSSDGWSVGTFIGSDGKIYYLRNQNLESGGYGVVLYVCNSDTKKLEKVENFAPTSSNNINTPIDGSEDYLFYNYNYYANAIVGFKSDGTYDEIYNTTNNGLDISYLDSFIATDNGFIAGAQTYTSTDSSYNVYRIVKNDESEIKEKTAVNLAAYYLDDTLRSAVANYNDSDGDYVITVEDYSQYNDYTSENEDDYTAGLTKLNAEISAGNIPDIMCMDYNPSYASKGLYLDLNTYIDGEDGLNREEYQDFILRDLETDGKLYTIPVSYYVYGFAEKKEFVSEDGKLSSDTLDSILAANEGMTVMSSDTTRSSYLLTMVNFSGDKFINSETNECYFDSPEFIKLLEDSAKYPEEIDYENFDWTEYDSQYVTNKALSRATNISTYDSLSWAIAGLGGEASVTGVPGLDENPIIYTNSCIMISSKSDYPEAGWQLIKSALSEENQSKLYSFPLNKAALDKQAQSTIDSQYYTDENGNKVLSESTYYINNQEVKMDPIDQSMIDRINNIIEMSDALVYSYTNDTSVTNIIDEEAAAYYAGTNTAETAAKNIQSRVSLYLSEQS